MNSLNDVLEKCVEEPLMDGILTYRDHVPSSGDHIDKNSHNYYVMKCYEGLMSAEEFEKNKSDAPAEVERLYSKYIFQTADVWNGDFAICDNDIEDLIYIRMMASPESIHLERLNKLMIRIYFEKKKTELEGLVQHIYKNDWAKEYIQAQKENELSLIFQEGTDEYNAKFGIGEELDEESSDEEAKGAAEEGISAEDDWILQKYGG